MVPSFYPVRKEQNKKMVSILFYVNHTYKPNQNKNDEGLALIKLL